MRIKLKDKLKKGLLVLDGAMGTQLMTRGARPGKCNDYLNIEQPKVVTDVHKAYLEVGCDAIITNTFGANRYALARHGLADEVAAINEAGANIARDAAGQEKYVLGDIGPCGDFLEPLGNLKEDELKEAFGQQTQALLAGGVDGFIIETMTAIEEAVVAVRAVKPIAGSLPVFASMSFDVARDGFRTMMGVDVDTAVSKMIDAGADAIGFNCGTISLDDYVRLAEYYVKAVAGQGTDTIIFAEPNAGKPDLIESKAVYKVTPDEFAKAVERIHSLGITVLGGCCGTTPDHIKAIAKRLKK